MPTHKATFTLSELFTRCGAGALVVSAGAEHLSHSLTGVRLLTSSSSLQGVPDGTLLVDAGSLDRDPGDWVHTLEKMVDSPTSLVVATWLPEPADEVTVHWIAGNHLLLRLPLTVDPVDLVAAAARAARPPEVGMAQRLASMQRAMTQALTEPEPLRALAGRLARTCNATVAIVREDGEVDTTSGPLPLAMLLGELDDKHGDTFPFSIGGWQGVGVRVTAESRPAGWLVVASRRLSFPESFAIAATHVVASLVETTMRIDLLARRQDRAVRSSLLEQLLTFRVERHDPELAGRLAALGMTLDSEVRVFTVQMFQGRSRQDRAAALEAMYADLDIELCNAEVAHLLAVRDEAIVGLTQASRATLQRCFARVDSTRSGFLLGIGRPVAHMSEIAGSFNDTVLAIRTMRSASGRPTTAMAYEDFEFAMRLFSDVGLDRMRAWAAELLAPIADQDILLEGLERYFEHGFNIIAAAKALQIHHNSLRYRLSRVEERLAISLRDPAAVSSIYLALTARGMSQTDARKRPDLPVEERRPGMALPAEAVGDVFNGRQSGLASHLGAAIGAER